ncbi:MAG: adenylosuccinate lyase, partial [Cyanobacteria bacterium]|nr:adenylosuccinate lyase [Cyanobacteriota bacterium]
MIERYSLPEMAQIWSQEEKFRTWLEVELAVVDVQEDMGIIPQGVSKDVAQKANFDIDRIDAIELEVKHDVIAFLTSVAEFVGENSRYVHLGMTSSDLIDTALSLQIQKAGHLILKKLKGLKETIARRAFEHQKTPMVGRSHGIHAEPLTFGLKLLVWVDELSRHESRITSALEENRVGKISGAVGTYSNILPAVEIKTCERLGLKPVLTATQIIQRDIHA